MSADEALRKQERLGTLPPTFTAAQAYRTALSSRDLASLVAENWVFELSWGVYRRADAAETAHLDLLAVAKRAPHAVVCGESALALHELIDDVPLVVHIAVARGKRRPVISSPEVVVSQYAAETFSLGVEPFEAAPGETVSVYSAARSVVDAMRLRHRIGEEIALSALARYLRRTGHRGAGELQRFARPLGAMSAIRPAVEAVLA